MKLGILLVPDVPWTTMIDRWRAAEELGFDSAWTYDHVWWRRVTDTPWFSAFSVLSPAAAVTERITLGTMVVSPNFRHPVLAVKDATTVDDVAGGRFVLGIGSGAASAGDAEALGGSPLAPPVRAARFDEFVELTARLLRDSTVDYRGRFFTANQVWMRPPTARPSRVPLAIAASGPRGMALAARHGRAWITTGPANWLAGHTIDECFSEVTSQAAMLRAACDEEGRSTAEVDRIMLATPMCGDPLSSAGAFLALAERAAEVGMTDLVVHWPRTSGIYAGDPRAVERIVPAILDKVHGL